MKVEGATGDESLDDFSGNEAVSGVGGASYCQRRKP